MRLLLSLLVLLLLTACADKFTINGLICPTNDQSIIHNDMQACQVYDLEAIDKALQNGECKRCLEQKGYIIESNATN